LGTKKHHEQFLPKMDTLEERGCFAMTELGHGSNVMGIETTVSNTQISHIQYPPYKWWGSVAELACHLQGSIPYGIRFSHKSCTGRRRPRMSSRMISPLKKGTIHRGVYCVLPDHTRP
jgi:hypothetical protein